MTKKSSPKSDIPNALTLLTEDHDKVLQLFSDFEHLHNDEEDEDRKRELVELACMKLTIHAQIEEELFYPALRDILDEQDLLDEARVEHDMAKQLIAELESMEPDEDLYDAKFKVLGEYVKHHIEEEQNEIFPKAKKAHLDLENIAIDMIQRKQELQEEFGMLADEEEDAASGFAPPAASKKPVRHPRA